MTIPVTECLRHAREALQNLHAIAEDLARDFPAAFEDPEVERQREAYLRAHEQATRRLTDPVLSIALIGTTSSGKSTLVNALVGREIAPMEAGETSGGVLTLRHAEERVLTVHRTEGNDWDSGEFWETGGWTGIDDRETYERIRNGVMLRYHRVRRQRRAEAPQVTVEGPLLPVADLSLLGLPPSVGIEILDLPGLKSIQDPHNLEVIQSRVNKAFSLVALDYAQTDEAQRRVLLEELKTVVSYLQGRTDSMIFLLNRADLRNAEDEPLETRLQTLRREIREWLGLADEPEILPFNALALYYVQGAWGPVSLDGESGAPTHLQRRLLRNLFGDCASLIRTLRRRNPLLGATLDSVEDAAESESPIDAEALRTVLCAVRAESGGEALWARLRRRVATSFPELVILPAVLDVLDASVALTTRLGVVADAQRMSSADVARAELAKIERARLSLGEISRSTGERFRETVGEVTAALASQSMEEQREVARKLGKEFDTLFEGVNGVRNSLVTHLISPVRDSLRDQGSAYDLEEKLGDWVPPLAANDVARAYDQFSHRIPTLTRRDGKLRDETKGDDTEGRARLEETERRARRLYFAMREALVARAELGLQGEAQSIRKALASLLQNQAKVLRNATLQCLPDLDVGKAVTAIQHVQTRADAIKLPERFFDFQDQIEAQQQSRSEYEGTRWEDETYQTSCLGRTKTRQVLRSVYQNVDYRVLELPDENGMAAQWEAGVVEKQSQMWQTLQGWMKGALEESALAFEKEAEDVLSLAARAFAMRIQLTQARYEEELKMWESVDRQATCMAATRDELRRHATTPEPAST